MILVVADDTSGATELAAGAAAYGLSIEFRRDTLAPTESVDVVIYDTQTRCLNVDESIARLKQLWATIHCLPFTLCYKKVDSILRGHVAVETYEMASALGFGDVWLCPANPSLNRIVREGRIEIAGIPAHETAFRFDPEFPTKTSDLRQRLWHDCRLGNNAFRTFPFFTPDAGSIDDLNRLAVAKPRQALAAGARDFFLALLGTMRLDRNPSHVPRQCRLVDRCRATLLVCGSKQAWPERLASCKRNRIPAFSFRDSTDSSTNSVAQFRQAVQQAVKQNHLVAVGIHPNHRKNRVSFTSAIELADEFGQIVSEIALSMPPSRLLIEGGGTASRVLHHLNCNCLMVTGMCHSLAVMRLPENQSIEVVVKPGSYSWPDTLVASSDSPSTRPWAPH